MVEFEARMYSTWSTAWRQAMGIMKPRLTNRTGSGARGASSDAKRLALSLSFAVLPLLLVACYASRPVESGGETFRECYESALEALRRGENRQAERSLKMAIYKNPRHAFAHYHLALIYAQDEKDELAMVGFQRALELEPTFPEALYNLGTIRLKRGESVAAVTLLEAALAQEPDNAATYVNLGKAYFATGLAELAGAAYEEALALEPDHPIALENLARLAEAAGDAKAELEYRIRLKKQR